jgi:site-specific DNA recombinase
MKAIIYARFSPRPRDQSETTETIESQVKRCREFAAFLKHDVAAVYDDPDVSGKDLRRPGIVKAIDHTQRLGKSGVLVVYSLSRLSRDTIDRLQIAKDLKRRGAQLASATEMFDTSTPHGRMIYTIMAAIDQGFREIGNEATSDKMLDYQDDGNGKGRRMGRIDRIRYGWEVDPDSELHKLSGLPTGIRRNEAEQATIGRILGMISQGFTSVAIARTLDGEGVDFRGKTWNSGTIRQIVKREG